MTEAKADWQVHTYGNTTHAFTNPAANNPTFGTVYKESAEKRAYQALDSFLTEIF
jgi:dienelactone hydrolase